jgi:hypothetical protein
MVSKFPSSSSDLSNQISNSLSTDLKATPDSSFSITTDSLNYFNANKYFQGSSSLPVGASVANNASSNTPFTSGYYTVDETGKVSFDYVFDGSKHQGELAIFSLEGMGKYNFGSKDFIREAARRALSNSKLGHVVISDRTEGARFNGNFAWEKNYNSEEHLEIKNFEMERGSQFSTMFVPNGTIREVLRKPNVGGKTSPLFSLTSSNQSASSIAQFAEIKTNAHIFAIEDGWNRRNNRDFNDFVFYMEGATGNAPSIDSVINPARNWRNSDVAKQISKWNPTGPQDGELVKGSDGKVYQIKDGKKLWISNPGLFRVLGFKNEDVKTFADEKLSNIPLGEKYSIPKEYQESPQSGRWNSELYWWDGKDLPSLDFSSNKDNLFATINLDSNLAFPPGNVTYGIDLNWGSGSPKNDSKLLDDNFVIRSYTQANFNGGQYTATVKADDGYQLFARNQATGKVVDITGQGKWNQDAYNQFKTIEFTPEAGAYDLYFQYFERTGDAYFSFVWGEKAEEPIQEPPAYKLVKGSDEKVYSVEDGKRRLIPNPGIFQEMGFKNEDIKTLSDEELKKIPLGEGLPIPQNYVESPEADKWYGKFYSWDGKDKPPLKFSENQENQFAALNLGSNPNGIQFDWGNGSPNQDTKLLSDNFAIAASKEVNFEDGTYTFRASGDDGFQIFAKKVGTNDPVINITPKDAWTQAYGYGARRNFQNTEVKLNGKYELSFNFYEQGGDAKFNLYWEKNDLPQESIKPHKYEFTYFFNGENKEGSDYYTGWVIAETNKGYKVGEYVEGPNPGDNEVGKNGRYFITKDAGEAKIEDIGKVFVENYYNNETITRYNPFNFVQEKPSGTNFLGSEYDFIGSKQDGDNDFGLDDYKYDIQFREILVETVSPSNGTVVRANGRVDKVDVDDYYRFYIGSYRADFELKLNELNANADVQLIFDRNLNGKFEEDEILSKSENNANNPEKMAKRLTSGTYYVRVYSAGGDTNYNLELSAKTVPNIKVEKYTDDPREYTGSVWTTLSVEPGNEGKEHKVSIDWANYRWEGNVATNPNQKTITLVYDKRNKDSIPRIIKVEPLSDKKGDFMSVSETIISNGSGSYSGAEKIMNISNGLIEGLLGNGWKEILPGYKLEKSDKGVVIYQKNNDSFLQTIDLSEGAGMKFLHGSKKSEGNSPKFEVETIEESWERIKNDGKAFSITNGQFFGNTKQGESFTFWPFQGSSQISYPLKIDNVEVTKGFDTREPENQLILELWNNRADINPFVKDDKYYTSLAPNYLVSLKKDSIEPKGEKGRTIIGLKDIDFNGEYETILIFNSKKSTYENAVDTLKQFNAEENKVIMLDGSGSTKLKVEDKKYLDVDPRKIPQTIGVLHG